MYSKWYFEQYGIDNGIANDLTSSFSLGPIDCDHVVVGVVANGCC